MYLKKEKLRPGTVVRHRFSFFLYSAVLLSALAGAFLLKSAAKEGFFVSPPEVRTEAAEAAVHVPVSSAGSDPAVTVSAPAGTMGWYFKKTDDHSRPPLDAPLAYTESLGAYYLDHGAEDDDKVIYLTFDAGYENGNVEKILDTLKAHNAVGAFFVLSHLVESNTALVCRMADEGHFVCNHTCHHKDMTSVSGDEFKQELSGLETLYREKTGHTLAPYYRPPEGKFDKVSLTRAQKLGYKTIFWSFAYGDWDNDHQPSPDAALENILAHTHNGMVILLHPTSATNAAILDRLLTAWEEQGYRFGTLDELTAQAPVSDGGTAQ